MITFAFNRVYMTQQISTIVDVYERAGGLTVYMTQQVSLIEDFAVIDWKMASIEDCELTAFTILESSDFLLTAQKFGEKRNERGK